VTNFRTTFQIEPSSDKIDYRSKILLLGSCFTENIGAKLEHYKFQVDNNPFGVLYNPVSVANGIYVLLIEQEFTADDLRFNNDLWYSFNHHSRFSDPDKEQALNKINTKLKLSSSFLKELDFLFITFGTAWIYRLKETKEVVSNCHKLPASLFTRESLTIESISKLYSDLIASLLSQNPSLRIVLTVSPVRHLKDGAIENQISKSTLMLAVKELVDKFEEVNYFPSYEIMMDDLRDYRFYAEDMVHPNNVAIDYLWEKFSEVYFEKETLQIMNKVEKIVRAKEHRPLNPHTEKHQLFLKNQLKKIESLLLQYPFLDFVEELAWYKSQLLS